MDYLLRNRSDRDLLRMLGAQLARAPTVDTTDELLYLRTHDLALS